MDDTPSTSVSLRRRKELQRVFNERQAVDQLRRMLSKFCSPTHSMTRRQTIKLATKYIEHLGRVINNEMILTFEGYRPLEIKDFQATANDILEERTSYIGREHEAGPCMPFNAPSPPPLPYSVSTNEANFASPPVAHLLSGSSYVQTPDSGYAGSPPDYGNETFGAYNRTNYGSAQWFGC